MIDAYEETYDSSSAWEELKGARFEACSFRNVNFAGVDLLQAVFERTNLKKADFRTAEQWTIDPAVNQVKGARFQKEELKGLLQQWGLDLRDD